MNYDAGKHIELLLWLAVGGVFYMVVIFFGSLA